MQNCVYLNMHIWHSVGAAEGSITRKVANFTSPPTILEKKKAVVVALSLSLSLNMYLKNHTTM